MALAIGYNQKALHESSIIAMNAVNGVQSWSATSSEWEAPKFRTARTKQEEPEIPASTVFQSLANSTSVVENNLPSIAECAVHLELLHALRALRVRVLQSTALDTILGIKPRPTTFMKNGKQVKKKDPTFETRRKEKWPIFVDIAVARFEIWFREIDLKLATSKAEDMAILAATVPPLDVLMVWHSFLLNPRWFHGYCEDRHLDRIGRMAFPWAALHDSIDSSNWSFHLPSAAQDVFQGCTGFVSNLYEYLVSHWKSPPFLAVLSALGQQTQLDHDIDNAFAVSLKLRVGEGRFLNCCLDQRYRTAVARGLSEAVKRQVSFVDKMQAQLWIRSPAIEGTLHRAQDRYGKFLRLFKWYPNIMLVPTLDIDLVWHTHQMSPSRYEKATLVMAGRFIDHNDKLSTAELNPGMEKTKEVFRIRFGQEYLTCTCWDCEAILSAVDAQNRVGEADIDDDSIAQQVSVDVAFHRAVEVARRALEPLPVRDQ